MGLLFVAVLVSCVIGIYAPITFHEGNCVNNVGHEMDSGTTWFNAGECAKYGCFVKNDERIQYKETCPDYPIPSCAFNLKKDPNGPFPECCDVPYCRNSIIGK
ncbi:U-scoloptoxin(16)-Er12a-like [Haliotis cracherodii]|uniref:U-scoloptoxin(16)-Er12a-like n=1 Tax=Haliotis cracherodii TaxID=6455 RepID=UPI0039E8AA85